MIKVTVYQNSSGQYCKFLMEGHAEFAAYGSDIVCAAVSAMVINTINSIEALTEESISSTVQKEKDLVCFEAVSDPVGKQAELLMASLALGLSSVAEEYGKEYISLDFLTV